MNNRISLNNLINELKLNSNASHEQIKEIITNLFIHIRINNECGKWVDIQDFGSFHPLWYKIKKYKQIEEEKALVESIKEVKIIKEIELVKEISIAVTKEKNIIKDKKFKKISYALILFLFFFSALLVILYPGTKKELKVYKSFKNIESTQTTTEKYYTHTIIEGDNLYSLSEKLYHDTKFWPLIYTQNNIDDMDKIYPGQIIKIPRILKDSNASKELAKIYIKTYKEYKRLGKDNKAQWLLFWFNKNIDKKFIEEYAKDISNKDKRNLQDYIKRFKPTNKDK